MNFVKEVHKLHHDNDAIVNGKIFWVDNSTPDEVISYIKKSDKQQLLIAVNTKNKSVETKLMENIDVSDILMSYGVKSDNSELTFEPYGYIVAQL